MTFLPLQNLFLGLQHYVIAGSQPYGLPLSDTTLAQHLQASGYATHAVGKVSQCANFNVNKVCTIVKKNYKAV